MIHWFKTGEMFDRLGINQVAESDVGIKAKFNENLQLVFKYASDSEWKPFTLEWGDKSTTWRIYEED